MNGSLTGIHRREGTAKTLRLHCAVFLSLVLLQSLEPGVSAQELSRDWVSTKWDVWCARAKSPDVGPCEDQETAGAIFQDYLESSSRWYQSLGFLGPKIVTQVGRYQAQIVHAEDAVGPDGKPYSGMYDPTKYFIYLNEDDYFALGEPGQTTEAIAFRVRNSYIFTSVHEVFHAIQATYSDNACGDGRDWICEGMADAALRAYVDKFESEMNIAMVRRPYNEPLHRPSENASGYGTWQFWLDVGRQLNSPDGIRYFRDVLQKNLDSHNGLAGVDRALKDLMVSGDDISLEEESGLYELLPWFFARHNADSLFLEPLRRSFRLEAGQTSVEKRITNIVVQPVAGRTVELTIAKPADRAVGVKIGFGSPDDDLHLIVDNVRYDKVKGENRNVYFAVNREERELKLDVVIANVAKAAQLTGENNVDLVVELMTEFASMGEGSGTGTPLPAGIDDPLPIELDEFGTAWIMRGKHDKRDDRFRGVGHAAGTMKPCLLQLQSMRSSKTGDQITISLAKSGPIVPDVYGFVDRIGTDKELSADPFDFPGEALGWFMLGPAHAAIEARMKTFDIATGTLTIESVEQQFVTGSVVANGVHRKYSTVTGKREIVDNRTVGFKFSVQVDEQGRPYSDEPYPCLASGWQ